MRELADALGRYSDRLVQLVARERQFTRDASHELRSPLTVIQISSELLLADETLTDAGRRAAERIRRAAGDMDELTNAFLLLAREDEVGLPASSVCINDVVSEELARAQQAAEGKPVVSRFTENHRLHVDAPERVLAILVGNLLRNAFSYTDRGEVDVSIDADKVVIRDTGVGMRRGPAGGALPSIRARGIGATRRARRRAVDRQAAVGSIRLAGEDREPARRGNARRDHLSRARARRLRRAR